MSATQARVESTREEPNERFEVIVIGGGQAGLAAGYFLAEIWSIATSIARYRAVATGGEFVAADT